jgi:dephospho-CoA kinase
MKSYHVGLTGSMGSGKSTVAEILQENGVPIYFADDSAKRLLVEDIELKKMIEKEFGESIYIDGILQRRELAKRAFSTPEATNRINAIVHPAVHRDFVEWHSKQNSIYVVREAAILFESGSYKNCDSIILVEAQEENRIARVQKRSDLSVDEIRQRMSKQMPQAQKRSMLSERDYIIENDRDLKGLRDQVKFLHEALLERFS